MRRDTELQGNLTKVMEATVLCSSKKGESWPQKAEAPNETG